MLVFIALFFTRGATTTNALMINSAMIIVIPVTLTTRFGTTTASMKPLPASLRTEA